MSIVDDAELLITVHFHSSAAYFYLSNVVSRLQQRRNTGYYYALPGYFIGNAECA